MKSNARIEYETAVKHARTACGSCCSAYCPNCKEILRLWNILLTEILATPQEKKQ